MSPQPEADAHEDLVDNFIWRLVLDPDAYRQIASLFGDSAAASILRIAKDHAHALDGTAWLPSLSPD